MKYYHPKWAGYVSMSLSVILSFAYPVLGILAVRLLFVSMAHEKSTFEENRNFYAGLMFIIPACLCTFGFLQKYLLAYASENLIYTFRKLLWEGILYKHVAWFDNIDRAPGVLTNILSEDITELNGLTSDTITHLVEAFLGITIGIILSFIFRWQMAFISLALSPFMLSGAIIMGKL